MDAPLAQCTGDEQRAVVCFLWSEVSPGAKIHKRLLVQYGDNALSKRTVYEYIEKFKSGRTSVKHASQTLKPAIHTKCQGLLSKKVLLQHDNACSHVAKATIETVNKLGFEVLKHPAYSPDHAPSNYHPFVLFKRCITRL